MDVRGTVRFYNTKYNVVSGGTLTFAPSALQITAEKNACNAGIENNGTLNLPNGLAMGAFNYPEFGASFTVWQTSGTMNLGGVITTNSIEGTFNVVFSGGTVNVTGNASFDVTSAQVSGPVTFNVAEGKTLNTTSLEIVGDGVLTKTGPGYIAFPATAQAVTVSEGGVALDSGTYDLSAVTFAANTAVRIAIFGGTINQGGYPASLTENATFTADLSSASAGTTIFNSNDAALLGKIKADLATFVPQGLELTVSGTQLMLETATSDADTFTVTGNITEGTGWGGSVPGEGANVAISGEGVVGTLPSGASFPAWSSIEVKNGATLRIEATATLPPITLNKHATLEIGNNATVTLATASDLSGVVNVLGDAITIPALTIEAGSTLNVPGGMKFKNLDLRHFGTIAASSAGRLYFGYADANETAYFAMCSTNATISTINEGSYGDGTPCFVCPAANGQVQVYGAIELDGLTLTRVFKADNAKIYDAVMVGVNNPVSAPFGVLFNNFTMSYRGYADFGGAATVTFRNSKLTRPEWQAWSSQGRWNVNDSAKVIFDNTEHYYEYPDGNSVGWFSSVAGTEAFVLTNSTVMWSRPVGNGNSKLTVYDSYYDCAYDAYITNQMYQGEYLFLPDLFDGLGELNIPENSFCALRALDHVTWDANDNAPERRCKVYSGLEIAGAGDLIVTNGVSGRYFEVIMQSDENTCTGNLKVDSPEGYDAKLYFADGANWAGTVTAGNVALTNLVDATAASTNTFNKLDLAAGTTFPIRVWKSNGTIVTHDGLNVTQYINNGGVLSFEVIGQEAEIGDGFILGTIGADSPLPAVSRPWSVKKDGNFLKVRMSSGLSVIFK